MNSDLDPGSVPFINPLYRLQFEKAQDAWVLLYPEGMVKLNQSAAEIIQRCDGVTSISGIAESLGQAFDTDIPISDITGFVDVAIQQNWLKLKESV